MNEQLKAGSAFDYTPSPGKCQMKSECCGRPLQDGMKFCPYCGKSTAVKTRNKKTRANGTGSVYKNRSGSWTAARTLGYHLHPTEDRLIWDGKRKNFRTKKEAVAWLASPDSHAPSDREYTFGELYEAWLPTHKASKGTMNCYTSAAKYLRPVWKKKMSALTVDDLQSCLDGCPMGKRTRQNMKALVGLVYKYGIPRHATPDNLNLGPYLVIHAEESVAREAIPKEYVDRILDAAISGVPYADYVACQCYLGFRPSEFLALTMTGYNRKERAFTGGAKTEAGRGRTVTVSPKIAPLVDRLVDGKIGDAVVFCGPDGRKMNLKSYSDKFYAVLESVGLENPVEMINGTMKHRYTPHACRHVFATMMKRVDGADRDKLALIGHTSDSMLRHYQSVDFDDLRRITEAL